MKEPELLRRLGGTEWNDFELKAASGGLPKDAHKTITAMANSGGGWIVFGVSESEDGRYNITGVDDINQIQNDLLSALRTGDTIRPSPVTEEGILKVDANWVLTLRVEESKRTDKPVRAKVRGRWQAYVRIGAGDHHCRPEEEGRFVRDATEERWDQTVHPHLELSDLDSTAIGWLRGLIENRRPAHADPGASTEEWLAKAGLIRKDESLTRAAGLLFGKTSVIAGSQTRGAANQLEERFGKGNDCAF